MKTVEIAKDFTRYPAGRYRADGPYSGEVFRDKFLEPSLSDGESVKVILDGARGYGSSFLEEAFGGLVRKGFSVDQVHAMVKIVSADPSLKQEIEDYIDTAGTTE